MDALSLHEIDLNVKLLLWAGFSFYRYASFRSELRRVSWIHHFHNPILGRVLLVWLFGLFGHWRFFVFLFQYLFASCLQMKRWKLTLDCLTLDCCNRSGMSFSLFHYLDRFLLLHCCVRMVDGYLRKMGRNLRRCLK